MATVSQCYLSQSEPRISETCINGARGEVLLVSIGSLRRNITRHPLYFSNSSGWKRAETIIYLVICKLQPKLE